jgi:hypothetical protein
VDGERWRPTAKQENGALFVELLFDPNLFEIFQNQRASA